MSLMAGKLTTNPEFCVRAKRLKTGFVVSRLDDRPTVCPASRVCCGKRRQIFYFMPGWTTRGSSRKFTAARADRKQEPSAVHVVQVRDGHI